MARVDPPESPAAAADTLGQVKRERDDSTDSVFEPVKLLPNPRRTQRMPDRPLNGYLLFITATNMEKTDLRSKLNKGANPVFKGQIHTYC